MSNTPHSQGTAELLRVTARAEAAGKAEATLTLPFELRCRSRLRAALDDGRGVALFLPRGEVLRGGDLLRAEDGTVIEMRAAQEECSLGTTGDPLALARACYHLGNRHVALEVGAGFVRYLHDHVLDEMTRALGLNVTREKAPFEPEPGAYPGAGASHAAHTHAHGHSHAHSHSHAHGHAH